MLVSYLLTALGLSTLSHASPWASRADDLSVAIVESTMARFTPEEVGPWQYFTGLYLLGQYRVYLRTGEQRYLDYIKAWADQFVNDEGFVNITFDSLDSMQAGNVFIILNGEYQEEEKYGIAAKQIRDELEDYPRTEDGAFIHAMEWADGQLWADGTFMINPFLIRYGQMYGEEEYAHDETTNQLLVYGKHLQAQNGLLLHAYDEDREEPWADPETGLSSYQWCRAMGWYGLAMMDILDLLPMNHTNRPAVHERLSRFAAGVRQHQDPDSGRWFQVVDMEDDEQNWTETSCSAMFTNALYRAIQSEYIDETYMSVVEKGSAGVVERIVVNEEGYTDVLEIVIGTGVGDLQFYFDRPRETNDLHGLGAVLLMNEDVNYGSNEMGDL